MGNENQKKEKESAIWLRPSMSVLEADLAYFDASLAMLEDKPATTYFAAQRRAFEALTIALQETVERLRGERKRRKRQKMEVASRDRPEETTQFFDATVITGPKGESLEELLDQLNDEKIEGLEGELEGIDDHVDLFFDGKSEDELEMEPVYYIDVDSRRL